jgi:hypothetical protein
MWWPLLEILDNSMGYTCFSCCSVSSQPVSAVLSSHVSVDDAAATLSKHEAVLEFMVNVDVEEVVS